MRKWTDVAKRTPPEELRVSVMLRSDRGGAAEIVDAILRRGVWIDAVYGVDLEERGGLVEAWRPKGEAKDMRAPPPPEERVGALHDPVHRDAGRARAARSVKAGGE